MTPKQRLAKALSEHRQVTNDLDKIYALENRIQREIYKKQVLLDGKIDRKIAYLTNEWHRSMAKVNDIGEKYKDQLKFKFFGGFGY